MRIALFPNLKKPEALKLAKAVRDFLFKRGVEVVAEDEKASLLELKPLSDFRPDEIDYLISLGGDGTILGIFHKYPKLSAPIFGINLGGLGFLAEVTSKEIENTLECLLKGKFRIQDRMVLNGKISENEVAYAVNEIVIHRGRVPSLIDLSISVDGTYLNAFSSDGLIISTPTGSTAYNLAAGGPILTPEIPAVVITPICPHTISNRPIVLPSSHKLTVSYQSNLPPVEVAFDGMPIYTISTGQSIEISISNRVCRFISFEDRNHFFSALRSKLNWTGKLRN